MQFNSIARVAAIIAVVFTFTSVIFAGQDMKNMPGMKMNNSNTHKHRKTTKKQSTAKRHDMGNMSGMNMPGMKMSGTRNAKSRGRAKPNNTSTTAKKPAMQNMPGMNMPEQKPTTTTTPQKMDTSMPGMQMPMPQTSPAP